MPSIFWRSMLAVVIGFPLWVTGAMGQPRSVTLDDVVDAVLRNNPTLEAARLEAEARWHVPDQVRALPDPTIGVTYQPLPILTARGFQRSQVRVEQMIPYPGKLGLQADIASLSATGAAMEARVLAAELIMQAKEAYYDLHHVQQLHQLVERFRDELKGFEESAAVRYEVGLGMQQAVLKAQVEKNQLGQRLVALEARRRSASQALARLTNQSARRFEAIELVPPAVPEVGVRSLASLSMRERPELAVLETADARAAKQVELARRQLYPDFGLSLTYFDIGSTSLSATSTGRDAIALGAAVRVPLQRGRVRAQIAEAEVRVRQIDAQRAALISEIETVVDDLIFTLEQERETIDLYDETLLPQAASTVEATLSAYTTGRTDFLNLLDAERTVFALRTGRADALNRYLMTTARLERVLGIQSLDDLDQLIVDGSEEVE